MFTNVVTTLQDEKLQAGRAGFTKYARQRSAPAGWSLPWRPGLVEESGQRLAATSSTNPNAANPSSQRPEFAFHARGTFVAVEQGCPGWGSYLPAGALRQTPQQGLVERTQEEFVGITHRRAQKLPGERFVGRFRFAAVGRGVPDDQLRVVRAAFRRGPPGFQPARRGGGPTAGARSFPRGSISAISPPTSVRKSPRLSAVSHHRAETAVLAPQFHGEFGQRGRARKFPDDLRPELPETVPLEPLDRPAVAGVTGERPRLPEAIAPGGEYSGSPRSVTSHCSEVGFGRVVT